MTMPGFDYHIVCAACGKTSDEYPMFPFSDIVRPTVILPAWSRKFGCFGTVQLDLNAADRTRMESNHEALSEFAAKLSSATMTVGAPRFISAAGLPTVELTPRPVCPSCGSEAIVREGRARV